MKLFPVRDNAMLDVPLKVPGSHLTFLLYFPYFDKIIVGLCAHHALSPHKLLNT
jgi:hypothetical protein